MSKKALNELIEKSLTDKKLNARMESAARELESVKQKLAQKALGDYDLTADEREAVIAKDITTLMALGVSAKILRRADWCTGD